MTERFSDAEARLLDRFGPPPLAPGFADRVTARLPSDTALVPKRRSARGGWRRGRIALVAGVGSTLLSVGAAAAGLLGARVQNMPVITTIATAVDAPRATPVVAPLARPKRASARPSVAAKTGESGVSTTGVPTQPAAGQLLADQIEARMKRRDAKGLSVPSLPRLEARRDALVASGDPRGETMTAALAILKDRAASGALPAPRMQREINPSQWRARMAALSDEDRAAIEARRQLRRQQRMGGAESGAAPSDGQAAPSPNGQRLRERWMQMTPEQRAEWRARRAAREALLSPEQRQQLQDRRAQRRSQMLSPREEPISATEPMPPESSTPQ